MRTVACLVVCGVAVAGVACASLIGLQDLPISTDDGGAAPDVAQNVVPDGSSRPDAPPEASSADAPDGPAYNDMSQAGFWSVFDIAQVPGVGLASGVFTVYAGATFDGRYLYFAPSALSNDAFGINSSIVLRLDTQGTFGDLTSWSSFDLSSLSSYAAGFNGAVFDGRYVYLIPANAGQASPVLVAQFDTTAPFAAKSSWSTFDVTQVSRNAGGYAGATFDGRYLYLVPLYLVVDEGGVDLASSGLVTRYDTKAPFTTAGSWSIFDTAALSPGASGFVGAVYDGKYAYFVPDRLVSFDGGAPAHIAARFDTAGSFHDAGSWSTVDTTLVPLDSGAEGFASGAFDGRYVYFAPRDNGAPDGLVVRYDTLAIFGVQAGSAVFDTTTVAGGAAGFSGAAFDGRYVYLVPFDNGAPDGLVMRWDTTAPFVSTSAWSTFDTQGLDSNAGGFSGAAFDGHYLYLVPVRGSVMARFEARSVPAMPDLYGEAGPPFYGSFY